MKHDRHQKTFSTVYKHPCRHLNIYMPEQKIHSKQLALMKLIMVTKGAFILISNISNT